MTAIFTIPLLIALHLFPPAVPSQWAAEEKPPGRNEDAADGAQEGGYQLATLREQVATFFGGLLAGK